MRNPGGRAQRAKKQHYVPRFYLRYFAHDGSHFYACDTFDGRSYGTRVEDVASASYFYDAPLDADTSTPGDRDPMQTLERRLADLEASASSALDALVNGIERNKAIDRSVRPEVARFLAVQVLRTQEARITSSQLWERGLAALRREPLAPSLEAWLAQADRPDGAAITQAHLLLDGSVVQTIADALLGHVWIVGLNGTSTPLWTSDHPVVRKAHMHDPLVGTSGLASPGIEIDFPLSPTMVLILAERTYHADIARLDGKTMALISDSVTYLNAQQAAQCYRHVYASNDDFGLLRRIRKERPDLFRPDRDRVDVVAPGPPPDALSEGLRTRSWLAIRKWVYRLPRKSGPQ